VSFIRNIFFVGLMGAGKTTVGRAVAKHTNRPFFDSDTTIEEWVGASIPLIFEHEGEEGFRERESEAIDQLTQLNGIVLATGGGAVLRASNRYFLKQRGLVIYLHSDPEDLWERTLNDPNRPLLQTQDPKQTLKDLYAIRDPLYREVAHFTLETDKPTVNQLISLVLTQLEFAGIPVQRDIDHDNTTS
jgi:shikimate kinase